MGTAEKSSSIVPALVICAFVRGTILPQRVGQGQRKTIKNLGPKKRQSATKSERTMRKQSCIRENHEAYRQRAHYGQSKKKYYLHRVHLGIDV
jgi:hypothetical protein